MQRALPHSREARRLPDVSALDGVSGRYGDRLQRVVALMALGASFTTQTGPLDASERSAAAALRGVIDGQGAALDLRRDRDPAIDVGGVDRPAEPVLRVVGDGDG